jgi:hypothetical protein
VPNAGNSSVRNEVAAHNAESSSSPTEGDSPALSRPGGRNLMDLMKAHSSP